MPKFIRTSGIAVAASVAMLVAGCGGGGGGSSGMGSMTGDMMPPGTETEFANLNATEAGYAATAASRVADAVPRSGSVTQSSNVNDNGITVDSVEVTATWGVGGRHGFTVRNGSSWSISTANGSPYYLQAESASFSGVELHRRTNGGDLYVDVYSDIEAPETRQEGVPGTGTPVEIQAGDVVEGLTLDEINARMGDGTLNGVPGTFSCDRASGGDCPSFFGFFPIGTDWRFTPHESGSTRTVSTPDTDYLAGGVWLFIPDNATTADDVAIGAFGDGNDPFRQSNLVALQGTARYLGEATGVYADRSENEVGYWDANVTLTADFGGRSDLGSIGGSVTGFESDGERYSGSMSLGAANIGSSNSGFFEGRLSGNVEGIGLSGRWGGQFFGNSEADGKPGSVGGTLGGRSDDRSASFVGVFGAYKQ